MTDGKRPGKRPDRRNRPFGPRPGGPGQGGRSGPPRKGGFLGRRDDRGRPGERSARPNSGPRRPLPPITPRLLALRALRRLEQSRSLLVPDVLADPDIERHLDARGRRFLHELVYGILRRRLTLDCIIAAYAREPISKLEPDCISVLRLGLYQLIFLSGVPPFAAISESVDLLGHCHAGVRALANGLLRTVEREANVVERALDRGGASPRKRLPLSEERLVFFSRSVFADPEQSRALHLAQVHSVPAFLVERWLARHDRAVVENMLEASNRKPRVSLRANLLRTDRDGLVRRLVAEGLSAAPGALPESVLVDGSPSDAVRTAAFREGLFYIQDEAAMKVARALAPRPGERVLDLCAAPGGKATHLAELSAGQAEIVAVDRDQDRMLKLGENCERLGLTTVTPLVFDPLALPGRGGPADLPELLEDGFDAVLLDAPCSNTGVLARRPEVRWRVSLAAIRDLAEESRKLFSKAVRLVRPGGRLLFSTCSLEAEENQDLVTRSLVANPALRQVKCEETLPSPGGPDGGFFALFEVEPFGSTTTPTASRTIG